MRVDCFYMVTTWAAYPEDEHRLLPRSLMALFKYPILPQDPVVGALQNTLFEIQARLAAHDRLTNPAEVWSSLDNEMRPSISVRNEADETVYQALLPVGAYLSVSEGHEVAAGDVVAKIPRQMTGCSWQPRLAGYALRHADDDIPWHRVVNARGELSPRAQSDSVHVQRARLIMEGVRFDDRGRIDLERFGWRPRRQVRLGR